MQLSPDQLGRAFEESLSWLHQYYDAHRIAMVVHNGTQCEKHRVTRNRKRVQEWIPKKSQPDYEATLTNWLGRSCWFDAKITTKATYHHPVDKLHQTDFLLRKHRADAVAFLLVQSEPYINEPGRAWLLWPQDYWRLEANMGFTERLYELPPEKGFECVGWDGVSNAFIPDWFETLMVWRASIDVFDVVNDMG